jgi:hypothetical protein
MALFAFIEPLRDRIDILNAGGFEGSVSKPAPLGHHIRLGGVVHLAKPKSAKRAAKRKSGY